MSELLKSGFGVLSTSQIRRLLKKPTLLLELQERVLTEGGSYWDNVQLPDAQQAKIDASTQRTLKSLRTELSSEHSIKPANIGSKGSSEVEVRGKSSNSRTWAILALVAVLLIAVGIWRYLPDGTIGGWGFEKAGLLTADVSSATYLSNLADAAGQWSNKRPTTTAELVLRLKEFRRGCDLLIQAPHSQLAVADRDWLVGKCREWAAKIDGYVMELQSVTGSLESVQQKADETINRLQQALRDRALQTA
jgi:nitrate reductase NapE component